MSAAKPPCTDCGDLGTVTAVRWAMVNVKYDDQNKGVASFHANALRLERK